MQRIGRSFMLPIAILPVVELVLGIVAPENGEISFVFETKHVIGFLTESGISLLIHAGIETVNLQGKGFEVLVSNGQRVKKGDSILHIKLAYIKNNAPSIATPIIY